MRRPASCRALLIGARDTAIRINAPAGIRLMPDPSFPLVRMANGQLDTGQPLAASAVVPLEQVPDYNEGLVLAWVGTLPAAVQNLPYPGVANGFYGQTFPIMAVEAVVDSNGLPNPPTSWFWNVRVGDKIRINQAGAWYTVVGPMVQSPATGNNEMFVNVGAPGAPNPLTIGVTNPEFLLLVNGQDDNGNGWVDEGFDGVDNNGNGVVDDLGLIPVPPATGPGEWEQENWLGPIPSSTGGSPYTIQRRPAPGPNSRQVLLPTNVVVDLTTWATTQERSRLQVDPCTGYVDVMVYPNGSAVPTTIYSSPSSVGMAGAFYHFWLAERSDVTTPTGTVSPTLPTPAGNCWLVTLFARSGKVSSIENPAVLVNPFVQAQQGVSQ